MGILVMWFDFMELEEVKEISFIERIEIGFLKLRWF